MTRRLRLAAVVAVLAVAGVTAWYFIKHPSADPGALVLTGNVDIRQVNLAFNVEGRIESMLAHEGDRVETGQKLATVENSYYRDALSIARARVEAQRAVVAKLVAGSRPEEIALARANVAEAEAALANARSVRQRQYELARRDVTSQQTLEEAETAFDRAQARRE